MPQNLRRDDHQRYLHVALDFGPYLTSNRRGWLVDALQAEQLAKQEPTVSKEDEMPVAPHGQMGFGFCPAGYGRANPAQKALRKKKVQEQQEKK